ncbi:hypothetical protein HHX47_DHR4000545 [Lentinula edodes]|nr:hypothetical protein HHX47_DHR4000545 [Lentinula edodes]
MADRSPAPKKSSSASYLKLSSAQRQHAVEELYMNLKLSDVWTAVRWKLGTPSEFQTAFGNLFPEKDHETQPKVQNYTQCRYYMEWKTICASGDAETITAARKELWRKVLRLQWIPQAASDKMWNTQQPKRQDASSVVTCIHFRSLLQSLSEIGVLFIAALKRTTGGVVFTHFPKLRVFEAIRRQ